MVFSVRPTTEVTLSHHGITISAKKEETAARQVKEQGNA
jgi:hypothetical protein